MKERKIPQRKCVGCDTMKSKKDLIRVVKSPTGEVSLDLTGKKAGRGAYVCPQEECITKAFKGHKLEKALGQKIDEAIYQHLLEGLPHE